MKIAVIGGGHNGLVAACYLARAGHSVSLFEARNALGGLCTTEEIFTGYSVSTAASWYGMFRPQIIHELDLARLDWYVPEPREVVLLSGGGFILGSRISNRAGIRNIEVSEGDRQGWEALWSDIARGAKVLAPYLLHYPPATEVFRSDLEAAGLKSLASALCQESFVEFAKRYLTNDALIGAACTGVCGHPARVGSLFGSLLKGNTVTGGSIGQWGFLRGGMGRLTDVLVDCALRRGVAIHTGTKVKRIDHRDSCAFSIAIKDETIKFDLVVCGTDFETLDALLGYDIADSKKPIEAAAKLHLALKRLPSSPRFNSMSLTFPGTTCMAPSGTEIVHDLERIENGEVPKNLMISFQIPSIHDPTVASAGKHLLTADIHYCSRDVSDADLESAILGELTKIFPSISQEIESSALVTASTLKNAFHLNSQCCWHTPITAPNILWKRVYRGSSPYKTPIQNLFVCGAGTHPGPLVSGANGHNCAKLILGEISSAP